MFATLFSFGVQAVGLIFLGTAWSVHHGVDDDFVDIGFKFRIWDFAPN
jgi:hypothetical protein